ncbi:MAG: hypothetical protein L6R41_003155 [Letrouitia leprolyta]|nr:MAG: hypothetical protein L6R41_003155 [Letrouitia leprolyta]
MEDEKDENPSQRKDHRTDAFATKFAEKTTSWQQKATRRATSKSEKPQPAGGLDETPIPDAPPGYTMKFIFHRANSLPMADLNSLSSDPYLYVQLNTHLPSRHKQDPPMRFRTPTIRRSTDPVWNCEWIVANVPSTGFKLKARIYDEDPADHDDRLGNVHVTVDSLHENWTGIKEQHFKIKKRMGSKRAYLIRGCAAMINRNIEMSGNVVISVEMLGKTEVGNNGGRIWTTGPCAWSRHLSPMIGRLAGTKAPDEGKDGAKTERYNFQANQFQLAGPVPPPLYHRYVEFKPFIAGMFTSTSLQGRILNRALHHQHSRIYNYDRTTVYGSFPSPSKDMSLQFLNLVHYDHGGRIFTYVLTLDGIWRFTETGKEFGIDLLSKHTMHSDVNIYIAFSGEFFVRRLKSPHKEPFASGQETHPAVEIGGGPPHDDPPRDPAYYALYIDNDSGTYRPNAKLLPLLKEFMRKNLPGLKIVTLDCGADAERMGKLKKEQRERKKAEGKGTVVMQDDGSSLSSSDEEELEARMREFDETEEGVGKGEKEKKKKTLKRELKESKVAGWMHGDRVREQRESREDAQEVNGEEKGEKGAGRQGKGELIQKDGEMVPKVNGELVDGNEKTGQ